MEPQAAAQPVSASTTESRSRSRIARNVILGLAAVWFILQGLLPLTFLDPSIALIQLVQRLALGFAVVTVALIDWSSFRGFLGIG